MHLEGLPDLVARGDRPPELCGCLKRPRRRCRCVHAEREPLQVGAGAHGEEGAVHCVSCTQRVLLTSRGRLPVPEGEAEREAHTQKANKGSAVVAEAHWEEESFLQRSGAGEPSTPQPAGSPTSVRARCH